MNPEAAASLGQFRRFVEASCHPESVYGTLNQGAEQWSTTPATAAGMAHFSDSHLRPPRRSDFKQVEAETEARCEPPHHAADALGVRATTSALRRTAPQRALVSVTGVAVYARRHQIVEVFGVAHAPAHLVVNVAKGHWVVIHVEVVRFKVLAAVPATPRAVRVVTSAKHPPALTWRKPRSLHHSLFVLFQFF